ncbi:AI-2E family transporter YdiK [Niveibacterium terrae]|uniref:AI-2E family transporter YdiK n=1 Tax=Niveibacterium terrae TaxID=3373598 RepID=UPI003A8E0FB3
MSFSPSHDLARTLFMILVIGLLITGSLWIVKPFLPALVWSAMIVVSTWPLMKKAQSLLWGRRSLAVLAMTLALVLIVALPIVLAIGTIIDHLGDLRDGVTAFSAGPLPEAPAWLVKLPYGSRLVSEWHGFVAAGPSQWLAELQPYAGKITGWIAARAGGLGMLSLHVLLTLALSAVLYARGEAAAAVIRRFAHRIGGERGDTVVALAAQAARAVAMGVVVTALVQSALGGIGLAIAGVPYAAVLSSLMFVCCVAQLGPTLVLIPATIWLFYQGSTGWGVFLIAITLAATTLDNILRPWLIRRGADLPLLLILAGVIGGLLAFGIVGLFVGPVVLAVSYTLLTAWIDEDDGSGTAEL